jgi:endonuclease YncB( thermonuclease family)
VSRLALGLLFALTPACATDGETSRFRVKRYDRDQIRGTLESEDAALTMGVFPLKKGGVVDGDTIKVGGLDNTLRLLGMDTEETFKSDTDKRLFETGWEHYVEKKRSETHRPIKVATPMGEEAAEWAKDFFRGVQRVRLERDHPKEIRGRFDRYLAYVFVKQDGDWINYNVEAVRAGMSPYFTKYGFSRRYHDAFVTAQEQARAQRLGIWSPDKLHYDDYDARLEWWNARGAFVAQFETDSAGRDDFIALTNWDAFRRLQEKVDEEVVVLATVGNVYRGDRVSKVMLSRRLGADFPLVFFDAAVLDKSGIEEYAGEYVRVSGIVHEYWNKRKKQNELQIVVNVASQVRLPDYTPPGNAPEPAERAAPEPAPHAEPADASPTPLEPSEASPAPVEDETPTAIEPQPALEPPLNP